MLGLWACGEPGQAPAGALEEPDDIAVAAAGRSAPPLPPAMATSDTDAGPSGWVPGEAVAVGGRIACGELEVAASVPQLADEEDCSATALELPACADPASCPQVRALEIRCAGFISYVHLRGGGGLGHLGLWTSMPGVPDLMHTFSVDASGTLQHTDRGVPVSALLVTDPQGGAVPVSHTIAGAPYRLGVHRADGRVECFEVEELIWHVGFSPSGALRVVTALLEYGVGWDHFLYEEVDDGTLMRTALPAGTLYGVALDRERPTFAIAAADGIAIYRLTGGRFEPVPMPDDAFRAEAVASGLDLPRTGYRFGQGVLETIGARREVELESAWAAVEAAEEALFAGQLTDSAWPAGCGEAVRVDAGEGCPADVVTGDLGERVLRTELSAPVEEGAWLLAITAQTEARCPFNTSLADPTCSAPGGCTCARLHQQFRGELTLHVREVGGAGRHRVIPLGTHGVLPRIHFSRDGAGRVLVVVESFGESQDPYAFRYFIIG